MRLLTVSAFFESHGGGVEIVAGEIARALGKRGHDSRLTGAAFDGPPTATNLTAIPLGARDPIEAFTGLPMPIPGRIARRRLEEEVQAADAIIIHDALYACSLLGAILAKKYGKPWILIQHIGEIPYSSMFLQGTLSLANSLVTKPMLARAPQVVFISNTVKEFFRTVKFRSPPKLLFNGLDNRQFCFPSQKEACLLHNKFGFSHERTQLLFVGRFVEKKGLTVIRALASIRTDCDVVMVGSGPLDPTSWNLPNVKVLGRRCRAELAELYAACDALILPSVGEGYPLVIQEAMATGMPVYCGTDSAVADPRATSFLVGCEIDLTDPHGTANRLAEAIGKKPAGRRRAAADYAKSHYNWDHNAEWIEGRLWQLSSDQ